MTLVRPADGELAAFAPVDFGAFVRERGAHAPVMQPRMGMSDPAAMRAGLAATKRAAASTVGTITLDSYTRVGDLGAVTEALRQGIALNGYPIVSYPERQTAEVLAGLRGRDFPVQVRHGSPVPQAIFAALIRLRLNATEGGPVSYCLPYGRTPLADSVRNWEESVRRYAALREQGVEPHLETFGGCMLGQMCPPSELVAISVLEALFFHHHGVRSLSLSYAQQTNHEQDVEAVWALRRLAGELLPTENWHVVVYAYMGVYPSTPGGCYRVLGLAAELAARTGSERVIVKTVAESVRIPTVEENVAALEYAAEAADLGRTGTPRMPAGESQTYLEARALVEAVLELDPDPGRALVQAFRRGLLDIPYCLHPDNRGRASSYLDEAGRLCWADLGALPLRHLVRPAGARQVSSSGLLADLSYVRRKFDEECAVLPGGRGLPPEQQRRAIVSSR
ncbi:methylaspartate mutase [Streptomyces tateyamensis]|uniref:Methylaspartate mutase n=1 Tax=Streptomyces tateyamensis TaxID=565073 RepID=A0A2V4NEA1_9ACTN|nr:methylaspartate mutase [Streptomyces tateyamensis]PYC78534.1 methylaspartate mutase [Streptomyces tateyamensis]